MITEFRHIQVSDGTYRPETIWTIPFSLRILRLNFLLVCQFTGAAGTSWATLSLGRVPRAGLSGAVGIDQDVIGGTGATWALSDAAGRVAPVGQAAFDFGPQGLDFDAMQNLYLTGDGGIAECVVHGSCWVTFVH